MQIKKGTFTVVAYGKTEDELVENILFDINELTKDGIDDTIVCIEDVNSEEEGIDIE